MRWVRGASPPVGGLFTEKPSSCPGQKPGVRPTIRRAQEAWTERPAAAGHDDYPSDACAATLLGSFH